jgi:hypothetical protein
MAAARGINSRLQLPSPTHEEVSMMNNIGGIISPAPLGAGLVAAFLANAAFAADISADSLKLAPGVAKAAGYETPATTYIVANSTNVYSGPSLVGTNPTFPTGAAILEFCRQKLNLFKGRRGGNACSEDLPSFRLLACA